MGVMLEECGDLGGSDLELRARGRITVDHGGVSTRRAEVVVLPNYVQACLGRTHPAGVNLTAVRERLDVDVVFLLVEARVVNMMQSPGKDPRSCIRPPDLVAKLKLPAITGSAIGQLPQVGSSMVAKES